MISMWGIMGQCMLLKKKQTIKTKQTMKTYQKAEGARLKGFPLAKCGII